MWGRSILASKSIFIPTAYYLKSIFTISFKSYLSIFVEMLNSNFKHFFRSYFWSIYCLHDLCPTTTFIVKKIGTNSDFFFFQLNLYALPWSVVSFLTMPTWFYHIFVLFVKLIVSAISWQR